MQRLDVSGAVGHIYVIRQLKVNGVFIQLVYGVCGVIWQRAERCDVVGNELLHCT
jgi:hypothetical protein